jgi:small-conductance mechanosensitive channel
MTTALLIILFAIDFIILGILLVSRRRSSVSDAQLIRDVTEERERIRELRDMVREDLEKAQRKSKDSLSEVKRIAAEIEQEVRGGTQSLIGDLESLAQGVAKKLDAPVELLSEKQMAIETLIRKAEQQRTSLQKLVSRGEKLCKFFDERLSYEEILDEIEDKKYTDARQLLAKGLRPEDVARDLGLSVSEVKLIASIGSISL